jgi:hypothetical protein
MYTPHVLLSAIALALLVGAAPDAELAAGGRYTITPADGGAFLRLDTHTGVMSVCQRKDGRWACEAVPDERRALETEIERLGAENKQLQKEVKRLEELLALPDPGAPDSKDRRAERSGPRFQLPSEADVDRAMDYIERMMRKFKERWREFKDSDRRSL